MSETRIGIDMHGVDFGFSEVCSLAQRAYGDPCFLDFVNTHAGELGIEGEIGSEDIEEFVEEYESESGCLHGPVGLLGIISDVVAERYGRCWCDVIVDESDTAFFGVPKLVANAWDVRGDGLSEFPPNGESAEKAIRNVWAEAGLDPKMLPEFSDVAWAVCC